MEKTHLAMRYDFSVDKVVFGLVDDNDEVKPLGSLPWDAFLNLVATLIDMRAAQVAQAVREAVAMASTKPEDGVH